MKSIQEIYKTYNIMPNLQEHMFRVAAVGELILDHIDQEVNRDEVVTALLLHDIGNIIKFNLGKIPEFLEPEGLNYWARVQKEFRDKYGEDENKGHLLVAEEIGASPRVLELIKGIGFHAMCSNVEAQNWAQKVCSYADLRVYPHGIVSLERRIIDGRERYEITEDNERWDLIDCAQQIEDQIFEHCDLDPSDITDESIAVYMERYPLYKIIT